MSARIKVHEVPQSRAAVTDQESGKTGVCAGIVGYADLALGPMEKVLEAMIEAG